MAEVGLENEPFLREQLIEHVRVTAKKLATSEGVDFHDAGSVNTVDYEVEKDYLESLDSTIGSRLHNEQIQSIALVITSPIDSEAVTIHADFRLKSRTIVFVLHLDEKKDPKLFEFSTLSPDAPIPYTNPTPIPGDVPNDTLVTFNNLLEHRNH
jgi:hypothetical protein